MKNRGFTLIELLIVIAIIAILALIAIPNFLEAQTRSKVARAQSDMRSIATAIEAYVTDYQAPPSDKWSQYRPAAGTPAAYYIFRGGSIYQNLRRLTTPVSYMTSVLPDVFQDKDKSATRMRVAIPTEQWFVDSDFVDLGKRTALAYTYETSVEAAIAGGLSLPHTNPPIKLNKTLHMQNWVKANGTSAWMLLSAGPDLDVYSGYRADYQDPIFNENGVNPYNPPATLPPGVPPPAPDCEVMMLVPWPLGCYDPSNGSISWGSIRRTASTKSN